MYTVIRVTSPTGDSANIHELITDVNAGSSAPLLEPRRRGDGYAAILCSDQSWAEHAAAMLDFVQANRVALRSVQLSGASVTVDVALEAEDRPRTGWSEVTLSKELLGELSAAGATFVVSLYAGDD